MSGGFIKLGIRDVFTVAGPLVLLALALGTGAVLARVQPAAEGGVWEASVGAHLRGDHSAALALVDRLLRDQPDNPDYLRGKAQCSADLGLYAEQAAAAERYLAVSPHPAEVCPALGNAYLRLGRADLALDAHRRCLDLQPDNPEAAFQYAFALEEAGRLAEAETLYQKVMRTSPHYLGAPLSIARLRLRQGRPAEAEAIALVIARRAPNNTAALLLGAMAAFEQGRKAQARRMVDAALLVEPRHPDLLAWRKRLKP